MKVLVVAEDFPWPPTGGGLIRSSQMVEVLSALGSVELFSLHDGRRTDLETPADAGVERAGFAHRPVATRHWWSRLAWLLQRGVPLEVTMRSMDAGPRRAFEAWVGDGYGLVWFTTPSVYAWLGGPRLGPTIVDLDNLEDVKTRQRMQILGSNSRRRTPFTHIRRTAARFQAAKNLDDWARFQRSVADRADRVALCSDADVRRSGLASAVLVPNGYVRPKATSDHGRVGDPPVLLFQGRLNYQPNMDACDWLVTDILPRLRLLIPMVTARLVGKSSPAVERLGNPPLVTVTGLVPEMEPELEAADLVVVPLRIGSGTRVKILEAFAHRIPVVSTSVGADGLDVVHGVHLLIADDAVAFAEACRRLIENEELRRRTVDRAHELYAERYAWSAVKPQVEHAVREVATVASTPQRDPR